MISSRIHSCISCSNNKRLTKRPHSWWAKLFRHQKHQVQSNLLEQILWVSQMKSLCRNINLNPSTNFPLTQWFAVQTEQSSITIDGSIHSSSSSPENTNSDDFVLVPNNLPTDPNILNNEQQKYEYFLNPIFCWLSFPSSFLFCLLSFSSKNLKAQTSTQKLHQQSSAAAAASAQGVSPPRPSSLPISEPKPVPLPSSIRRLSRQPQHSVTSSSTQKTISNAIPRSQPISMRRTDQRSSNVINTNNIATTAPSAIDISSISPPAVQFAIGSSPLGARRRSTSGGSLSESPPVAPYLWQISPTTQQSPPIRQTSTAAPQLSSGALTKMPALESPNFNLIENNNLFHHPLLGARAFTLPEMNGATGGFYGNDVSFDDQQPLTFHAPELPVETLLDRSHNETLAKLNFVVALCDCILEVADAKCAPLSALMSAQAAPIAPHAPEHCKRSERLVLLVRYVWNSSIKRIICKY